ncbi:LysR family transcriptional regulator [Niallia sp. 03133]|uniref:LysR family transcriptional regulator n=1 Tax=Niallia sp. 03133 TaxID=3458060 RepID=UPI0040449AA1
MELKQLKTFKIAAETLNFTMTAKQLNFAQSSVTAQIKNLEAELGTPLFERLGKRLVLTEAGRHYKLYVDEMLRLTEEAHTKISGTIEEKGTLIIGAQESQCTYRLPAILKAFKQAYPQIKLIFKPANSDATAREQLIKGELDIAFITDVIKSETQLHMETLIQEKLKLVASADHSLVNEVSVSSKDLETETLLLTESSCSYRIVFEETLSRAGCFPPAKFEFVSIEAIKQCVMAGLGIAILPSMTVEKEILSGSLKELRWENSLVPIYTSIAWHKDKMIASYLQFFIDLSRKTFRETVSASGENA